MKKETRDEFIGVLMAIECIYLDCAIEGEDPPLPGLLPAMRNFFEAYKADLHSDKAYRERSGQVKVDPYTVPEDPDAWRKVREVPEGWSALAKGALLMEGDIWNGRESWEDTKEEGGMVFSPDMYYRRDDRS